mmetsp:Transcript_30916/g.79357  ORF Transcript_30916/g.79357 Transcript_30916/m.79357 type:complete len:530 (-) Transcript_30916:124-1713(-)
MRLCLRGLHLRLCLCPRRLRGLGSLRNLSGLRLCRMRCRGARGEVRLQLLGSGCRVLKAASQAAHLGGDLEGGALLFQEVALQGVPLFLQPSRPLFGRGGLSDESTLFALGLLQHPLARYRAARETLTFLLQPRRPRLRLASSLQHFIPLLVGLAEQVLPAGGGSPLLLLQASSICLGVNDSPEQRTLLALDLCFCPREKCAVVRRVSLKLAQLHVTLEQPAFQLGLLELCLEGQRVRHLGMNLRLLHLGHELLDPGGEALDALLCLVRAERAGLLRALARALLRCLLGVVSRLLTELLRLLLQRLHLGAQLRTFCLPRSGARGGGLGQKAGALEVALEARCAELGDLHLLVGVGQCILARGPRGLRGGDGHHAVAGVHGALQGGELRVPQAVHRVLQLLLVQAYGAQLFSERSLAGLGPLQLDPHGVGLGGAARSPAEGNRRWRIARDSGKRRRCRRPRGPQRPRGGRRRRSRRRGRIAEAHRRHRCLGRGHHNGGGRGGTAHTGSRRGQEQTGRGLAACHLPSAAPQ